MINLLTASKSELKEYIDTCFAGENEELFALSKKIRKENFGNSVFLRGLIEISNYCQKNCFYCGIRASNQNAVRYRLEKKDILNSCESGYKLGFRTFVLQGGEDPFFSDDILSDIVYSIKKSYPDVAITLSLGERSRESYRFLHKVGADRYLLRHETADKLHYEKLHPLGSSFGNRRMCLYDLKELDFQVGAGFMVGSPFQTTENLAEDLIFLRDLKPQMVGIGPFLPHKDTPFSNYVGGELNHVLVMLAMVRVMLPSVLLPATTALSSMVHNGRELGLSLGANVVMPNLSPLLHRGDYSLYNGKLHQGAESVEGLAILKAQFSRIGMYADMSRGDHIDFRCNN